ncbi:MAG: acyl-homoserine-lactone synthase [Mixta calida]|nr:MULTISPECIES: acyl-homoserine-lactone synthase [Mixta]MDU3817046.1 acyl-homoserine-lactone synthase [Pantoea sp.]MCR1566318.1 acyl-homoserine-lactone synthase [Mixta sp.]MDU3075016.1 acyl-homoserine-lactone synthase [Mixta calida]MDU4290418.1 acyl-homoserine-lactone synthase [Mixta calida]MDU4941296.1 acyl-homoserine-lactone synthase [Mixta calida]
MVKDSDARLPLLVRDYNSPSRRLTHILLSAVQARRKKRKSLQDFTGIVIAFWGGFCNSDAKQHHRNGASMINFLDINYQKLSEQRSSELFILRKETFKDRLDWAVNCINGMEFDEYDNEHTTYVFGIHNDNVLCSVRFIETRYPNMISHTFAPWFDKVELPQGNYIESSRFFVDKDRARSTELYQYPISNMLFLAMVNYARHYGYEGIYTLVSHAMLRILKRSGWQISVIEQTLSEKKEKIYIVFLPIDDQNRNTLIEKANPDKLFIDKELANWPLNFQPNRQPV